MLVNEPLPLWEAARKEMEHYHFMGSLLDQPKWDIQNKMSIFVAVSGRAAAGVPGADERQFPRSIDEFIDAATEVLEAGATGLHIDFTFVEDRKGRRIDSGEIPMVEAYGMVLEPLRARFGKSFVSNLNVLNGKTFEECVAPARAGLAEVAPCAAGHPDAFMLPAMTALEELGVKPEIAIHSSGEIELAKRKLIDTGIVKKPYNWNILFGLPFNSGRTLLSGTWVPNAADMTRHLMMMIDQIHAIDKNSVITVCGAGRSTLYLTTLATMLGVHIRVGIEDTVWRYPNSNEMFSSNLDMFNRAKQISEMLGRPPMTGDEFRKELGLI